MASAHETRKFITPYAFGVSDSLIGKPLASPTKRLFAILLDLIVVAFLMIMSIKMLALCVCIVSIIGFFKARKRPNPGFAPKVLIMSAIISGLVFLGAQWLGSIELSWWGSDANLTSDAETAKVASEGGVVSILKTVFSDLGLGFGWAALYFSVFTAWLNGQSLGKMLLRIRVVKLDDRPLTLWESFERYGGYSAGLATGLLGFLQIFWDANRQSIHDKISETMVVDLTKADRVT